MRSHIASLTGYCRALSNRTLSDDIEHMKRVNGYVKRHLGLGPKKDPEDSKWRYSLV
jgi:Protein of unknown function (DUF3140)